MLTVAESVNVALVTLLLVSVLAVLSACSQMVVTSDWHGRQF